ncbi:ImmA/IrrE family metallo-endopeptidase [Croceicoccus ponticola]|uniref:ImmA/IrrE family metallo-endopeptidase n=1 Tax=Croceicoccus ponticola TaxID=2217664 RepID=A0A437GTZ7_9SPHN|nr:ImmA/IrrE family metallo-endopeptidase [Croceicoccus ponticola]RVQ64636.1 ImmA/IrrE family metallo-endopeptidase [Croceicoccus ponticola]
MNEELLMELADCGSPERLLAVIFQHHPQWTPPIQVEEFALSVGIIEFRDLEVDGFVGALMTNLEKTMGVILAAKGMGRRRRRFTIGHELGHYLIPAHRGDKNCTSADLAETRRDTLHRQEEAQANRFSAGLLMPKPSFKAQLETMGTPEVSHIGQLAEKYDVSREAVANRYVELTAEMCAVVFTKDGRIRYGRASKDFPALSVRPGDATPSPIPRRSLGPVPASDWLKPVWGSRPPTLLAHQLDQSNGHGTVLLHIDTHNFEADEEEAELIESYTPRFRR